MAKKVNRSLHGPPGSTMTSHLSEAEKRVRETAGQITRQIRTRPSRQELETLRQQVSSGTYQVDAKEIAARMLLMEEH